jgi:hypothetical protein
MRPAGWRAVGGQGELDGRHRAAYDRLGPAFADGMQFVRGPRVSLARHGSPFYRARRWSSVVNQSVGSGQWSRDRFLVPSF